MTNVSKLAGLSVVLKPMPELPTAVPLGQWLPEQAHNPVWVPVKRQKGVTKAMPVLSEPAAYPQLLQTICQRLVESSAVEWEGKPYRVGGVELEPDDLHLIQLTLTTDKSFPPTMGRAVHALCLQWMGRANEAIAADLHTSSTTAFTTCLQACSRQSYQLQIRLLDKILLSPLLWGLSPDLGAEIKLVAIPCRLSQQVDLKVSSSFKTLLQVEPQTTITLKLLSPTSFKQGKIIQPFPLPELVFGSLLRRWNQFAPAELHFPKVDWQGMVSAYDLKTHALRLEGSPEIGSQGWVKYRFSDPEQARMATILAHYAGFAGVGRKTTMGMGQAQIINV